MATTMHNARVVIATASTRIALGGGAMDWVDIRAHKDNQGILTLGSVTVTCNGTATDGRELWPGEPMRIEECELAELYMNGKVVGDGLEWCAASTDV